MLYSPATNQPPVQGGFVGFGIKTTHVPTRQRHVALIYCASGKEVRLSHLPWDYRFTDEAWDNSYYWTAAVGLDEVNAPFVAAYLNHIARCRIQRSPMGLQQMGLNSR